MSRSIRVAKEHIGLVKSALQRHGFPSQQEFATQMGRAYATVNKFCNGKPIDACNFVEFSERLGLDWHAIAYIDPDLADISEITVKIDSNSPLNIPSTDPNKIPHNLDKFPELRLFGRDFTELDQYLQNHSQVAITAMVVGMGGVGKTQLAIQYAKQYLSNYPGGICWLSAQGEPSLELVNFAITEFKLTIPDDWDLPTRLKYCYQQWKSGTVLLIFDDVNPDNYEKKVKLCLPPILPQFKVLFTTRQVLSQSWQKLTLDVLLPEAAKEFLEALITSEKVAKEPETAARLCEFLGYLPLALELVGRYLKRNSQLTLANILKLLEDKKLQHRALVKPSDPAMEYQYGVAAAFELSWEQLEADIQRKGCYLSLYGLAPIVFDVETIKDIERQENWIIALNTLVDWHLLELLENTDNQYLFHPLVREFFRDKFAQFPPEEQQEYKDSFLGEMIAKAKIIEYSLTRNQIEIVSPWIPHLEEVAHHWIRDLSDDNLMTPSNRLGRFYKGQGLSQQAESWYQQSQKVAKDRFGEKHPDYATALNNLAAFYQSQGRYSQAEPLYQRALVIDETSFPPDHPNLATDLNNLAGLYYSQGRYSQAEPFFQRALAIKETSLPPDHPNLAISLNNLAQLYSSQGRYSEAEPLYQKALAIVEKSLPPDHPNLAISLNNLAELYRFQGRYSEAEPLYQRALVIDEKALPPDHPSLARNLNNLAAFYESQGRYSEAEPLCQKALAIVEKSLPPDHPDLATHLNNLALLYYSQGRYSEAEPLYQKALAIDQTSLLPDHPYLARDLNNLAELYYSQGRYSEAEPLYIQALRIVMQKLGENHPNTQKVSENYRTFLSKVLEEQRTEELSEEWSLEIIQKMLNGEG